MSRRMREPFHTLMWKASIGYNDSWSQVDPEVLERFAELIVKEHIDILRQSWYDLNNLPQVSDESPRDIGIRVGRKAEINALIEKFHKHWGIER